MQRDEVRKVVAGQQRRRRGNDPERENLMRTFHCDREMDCFEWRRAFVGCGSEVEVKKRGWWPSNIKSVTEKKLMGWGVGTWPRVIGKLVCVDDEILSPCRKGVALLPSYLLSAVPSPWFAFLSFFFRSYNYDN